VPVAATKRIHKIVRELEALPRPDVDRATVEFLLGVGRRRAQQIMAPAITSHIGASGLVDRDLLIDHLRRLAEGITATTSGSAGAKSVKFWRSYDESASNGRSFWSRPRFRL